MAPAILAGIIGALLLVIMFTSLRHSNWPYPQSFDAGTKTGSVSLKGHENGTAMRYVRALQDGNCDEAIALTLWMNDRIELSRLEHPEQVADVREELCGSLSDHRIEGNRLAEEGMEDQYILAPGSRVTLVKIDEGRNDLERPVSSRVWIGVTYSRKDRAPLDLGGLPIRSLLAGISTTHDSYVLKAAVVGNLEIDYESIGTDWSLTPGEE